MPMYEIADCLAPVDETSLGLTALDAAWINDDRASGALETFYQGQHKDVIFHLALRAIKYFELDCSQIRQDTTTVTFCGKYEHWHVPETMTHGINKDHRPDLKQLVLGLSVTADGSVPLVRRVYDGNQRDDRLHNKNHRRLRNGLRSSQFIYVVDGKLATKDNLVRIDGYGGRFVSVMPGMWKQDHLFREKIRQGKVEWKHCLSRKNNRKPDSQMDRYYQRVRITRTRDTDFCGFAVSKIQLEIQRPGCDLSKKRWKPSEHFKAA